MFFTSAGFLDGEKSDSKGGNEKEYTVKPVYNGQPWKAKKWSLEAD